MKKIIALLLVLVMVMGQAACGAKDSGEKTIAVIAKGESHAFWQAVKAGAEKAAAEKGYKLTFQGPASEDPKDVPSQITMVQTALSNNVDGIVLATIGSGFGELLTQAYDKKIPVVTFDSGLKARKTSPRARTPSLLTLLLPTSLLLTSTAKSCSRLSRLTSLRLLLTLTT